MKISFDPLGNRMSYTAWNTKQTQTSFTFGHFFSPDPFVQAPDFTQNYNRYSYCLNNPVMYSDPDGEFFGIPMFGLAFIGRSVANLIDGVENSFGSAWQQASSLVAEMDRCLQFSISLGENTNLSFGISPFSIGANVGISYTNGTYINYTGFEIGPYLGGGYYNPFSLYQ